MPCNLTGKGRDARDLALRQRLGCERQSGCGFKISLRHFVSNGSGHNEPKFGIRRAGLCRSSRFHRIKAAKAFGAAYDGAAQFLSARLLPQPEVVPELIALLVA
jgi:hypothetical protein